MGVAIEPSMGALGSLPGVSNQMAQDQGVLRQIADNELMAEVAPLLRGRAVAKLGMDPTRTSFLPHYTPRTKYQWEVNPSVRGPQVAPRHPQENTLGTYYYPRQTSHEPWQKDLMQDYNLPNFDDRIVVWSDPKHAPVYDYEMDDTPGREGLVTPEVERALQAERDSQLATLAHEADHRGAIGVLREEIQARRDALWEQMDAIQKEYEKTGKYGWWKDPRYVAAETERDQLTKQLPVDRGPETEELRVRSNDALWLPRYEDRREAQDWLNNYHLDIDPRPDSLSALSTDVDGVLTKKEDLVDPQGALIPDSPRYPYTAGVTFQRKPYVSLYDLKGDYVAGPPGASYSPPLTLSQYLDLTGSHKLENLAWEKLIAQGRSPW